MRHASYSTRRATGLAQLSWTDGRIAPVAFAWWLFGDIVAIANPRTARAPGSPPTRRSAHWLIGLGLFFTLFWAIGISTAIGGRYESEDATIIGAYRYET